VDVDGCRDVDMWDPTTWSWLEEEQEHRLYLDGQCEKYAVLDYIDYIWAIQWCWHLKASRGHRKFYAVRSTTLVGQGAVMLYLHVEIMKRTGVARPKLPAIVTDHRDGDSMNCRRRNLRWASHAMNRRNIFGQYPHDLVEDLW
jgi:hypothetical protein